MPTTLTGVATDPTTAPQTSGPSSGDLVASAPVDGNLQGLLNNIAWLRAHGAWNDLANTFTQAQVFQALVTLAAITSPAATDLVLRRAATDMLALTTNGIDAKNQTILNVDKMLMHQLTADPAARPDGALWYRSDLSKLRAQINGAIANLATEDWVAAGGGVTAGAITWNGDQVDDGSQLFRIGKAVFLNVAAHYNGSGGLGQIGTIPSEFRPGAAQMTNIVNPYGGGSAYDTLTVSAAGLITVVRSGTQSYRARAFWLAP